ncbi:MAG: glycosyltransferase [Thermoguttaceae bacterium]
MSHNDKPTIFLLLAAYRGAAYLPQLVESIRLQTRRDWTLLARDDGSPDATPGLLHQAAGADERIAVIEDGRGRLGPSGNYAALMEEALGRGAQYLFFADQDDVWRPEKLRRQMQSMEEGEWSAGRRRPHLVYCDLAVMDHRLRLLHPSLLAYSRLRHGAGRPLRTLVGRNFASGCACGLNRPLAELALPLPSPVAMYDWWVALCAAAAGHVSQVPEPLVLYRRHPGTVTGQGGFWSTFNPLRPGWRRRWQTGVQNFRRSREQVRALRDRLRQRSAGDDDSLQLLDRFCQVVDRPGHPCRRLRELARLGIPALDPARRLLYYLCTLLATAPPPGRRQLPPAALSGGARPG